MGLIITANKCKTQNKINCTVRIFHPNFLLLVILEIIESPNIDSFQGVGIIPNVTIIAAMSFVFRSLHQHFSATGPFLSHLNSDVQYTVLH